MSEKQQQHLYLNMYPAAAKIMDENFNRYCVFSMLCGVLIEMHEFLKEKCDVHSFFFTPFFSFFKLKFSMKQHIKKEEIS